MNGTNLNIKTEPNGSITISSGNSTITINDVGHITISAEDPVFLSGASKAKIDAYGLTRDEMNKLESALASRISDKRFTKKR